MSRSPLHIQRQVHFIFHGIVVGNMVKAAPPPSDEDEDEDQIEDFTQSLDHSSLFFKFYLYI